MMGVLPPTAHHCRALPLLGSGDSVLIATDGMYTKSLFAAILDLWFELWVLGNP